MGTRNLTVVHHDGKYKLAQYGQWDGYPSGQGTTILQFLREMDREKFLSRLSETHQITKEEIATVEADPNWTKNYPHLSRDAGGKILKLIADSTEPLALQNQLKFAGDSLFCEWAYVVDFDTNKLEVYKGFNKQPLTDNDRFYSVPYLEQTDGYYPVRLLTSFDLNALPDDESFVAVCQPPEEEAA